MLSQKQKKDILDKIRHSREFNNSRTFNDLLGYLVEKSIGGSTPKEATIAIDVFHKDSSFDSQHDATVRVYVHNLRKKLDSYYRTEGADDPIKLSIPVGTYHIEFIRDDCRPKIRRNRRPALFTLLLFLLSVFFCLAGLFTRNHNPPDTAIIRSPVWQDFFNDSAPTMIILGDYFFYQSGNRSGRVQFYRDVEINSSRDLENYMQANNLADDAFIEMRHTYLAKFAPWCLYHLQPYFVRQNQEIELRLLSEVEWEDLQDFNIIFFGSFKSLGILKSVVSTLHFQFKVREPGNVLYFKPDSSDHALPYKITAHRSSGEYKDYAVVAKLPLTTDRTALIVLSTLNIGSMAAIKYFLNEDKLARFSHEHQIQQYNDYFEALFEVKGYGLVDLSIDLVHVNSISKDFRAGTNF